MRLRAVIFDIYKTLLHVGPPPADAADRWKNLWITTFEGAARLSLEEFDIACKKVIAREHDLARANGISHPEIYWPTVTSEVIPGLKNLPIKARDEFLYQHAQLQRTVRLMDGAAEVLDRLLQKKIILGIASNAQPYTLREVDGALPVANVSRKIFSPDLTFFSFENGFSKPDPHVFRLLTARAQAMGLLPEEILMVGDRLDNDIVPARAAGWQTWHFNGNAKNGAGDWNRFKSAVCA